MKLIGSFRSFANAPKILTCNADIVWIDRLFDYVSVYTKQQGVSLIFSCERKGKRPCARHGCEDNINRDLKEVWTGLVWPCGSSCSELLSL